MASDTDTVTGDISSAGFDYDDWSDVVELASRLLTTFRVGFSLVTIILVVGLVANGFVLYAILRSKKLRNTVYNVYIVSLSVSNFIFLLVWGLTDAVIYGIYLHKQLFHVVTDSNIRKLIEALCDVRQMSSAKSKSSCRKVVNVHCIPALVPVDLRMTQSTMVINCFMITALAVDRYAIVAHPQALHNRRTVKNALIGCGIVWAVCFGLTIGAAETKRNASTLSLTSRRRIARKTRFLALIGSVSLSFFISWGYWHGYYLAIWPHVLKGDFYHRNVVLHISLNMLTDVLVLFNAALNPILYVLNQPHMKRHLASLFPCGRISTQHAAAEMNNGRSDGTTESVSVTPNDDGVAFNVAEETLAETVLKSTSGI
nr:adrenocorticotropic hormone receptor-like [Lytechinus pictus]